MSFDRSFYWLDVEKKKFRFSTIKTAGALKNHLCAESAHKAIVGYTMKGGVARKALEIVIFLLFGPKMSRRVTI